MGSIEILKGKILTEINAFEREIIFTDSDGKKYKMYHDQDCCEEVTIDDVVGDWVDLLNSPILEAEGISSGPNGNIPAKDTEYDESFTWTFYKIGTIKGRVTIKWYGTSNGYYSESVEFEEIVDSSELY